MEAALEVSGVTKTFAQKRAVDDMHLVVPRGATYGLIGPSGAGKTTAIRMIMSILFPDRGTLRMRYAVKNQKGETVMTFVAIHIFRRRG